MKKFTLLLSMLLMTVISNAQAQDGQNGEALVSEAMCYACHQMQEASLGPPWQAIAARHAANSDLMKDVLAGKIMRGGGGNWGNVPMVANQRVDEEQARIMAAWILAQTPE